MHDTTESDKNFRDPPPDREIIAAFDDFDRTVGTTRGDVPSDERLDEVLYEHLQDVQADGQAVGGSGSIAPCWGALAFAVSVGGMWLLGVV